MGFACFRWMQESLARLLLAKQLCRIEYINFMLSKLVDRSKLNLGVEQRSIFLKLKIFKLYLRPKNNHAEKFFFVRL